MAEPVAPTVGIAIAAGTLTITGTIFGVQYDALLAGFFGGLVSLSFLPPMSRWKLAGSIAGSALLAGFFAPVCAAAGLYYFAWLSTVGDFSRIAAAAVIGLCWQAVLPACLSGLRRRITKEGEKS
jgi:hypothetical protein